MWSAASSQEQGAWEEEEEFADEAKEKFQETRRRTQSGQLDVLQRLSTGEGHTLITGGNDPSHLTPPQLNSFVSKDACFLGQNPGSCQDYTMMWFFDTEQNECSRFWFGGCGGNENRFKTQDECENLCLTKSR